MSRHEERKRPRCGHVVARLRSSRTDSNRSEWRCIKLRCLRVCFGRGCSGAPDDDFSSRAVARVFPRLINQRGGLTDESSRLYRGGTSESRRPTTVQLVKSLNVDRKVKGFSRREHEASDEQARLLTRCKFALFARQSATALGQTEPYGKRTESDADEPRSPNTAYDWSDGK